MAARPCASVIEASDGRLYGTTFDGGAAGFGTVFRSQKDGSEFEVIYSFGMDPADGRSPWAGVVEATDHWLYGVTTAGGSNDVGVVFRVARDGTGHSILHHFTPGTSDGQNPYATLIQASDGMLYGTCYRGGASNGGTLFKLSLTGSGYTVLKHFAGGRNDGANPSARLLEASDGVLYGTTESGGNEYYDSDLRVNISVGTIYKIARNGTGYSLLRKFSASNDGRHPSAPLIEAANGLLYGTTPEGGTEYTDEFGVKFTTGIVFRIGKSGGSTYSIVRQFLGVNDAQNPAGGVIEGGDGYLYGATEYDHPQYAGALFRVSLAGTNYAVLFRFSGTNGRGASTPLWKGSDSQLYGTTSQGGQADAGTLFRFEPATSNLTVVVNFSPSGGEPAHLEAPLIEGSDGWLYGLSRRGGTYNAGAVFKLQKNGSALTVLHSFVGSPTDGRQPIGRLLEAGDGALYGTTYYGGANLAGTLFKLNQDGSGFAIVYHFQQSGSQARNPAAGLIEDPSGRLYGTTQNGGSYGRGTVFRVNRDGSEFTVLLSFSGSGLHGRSPAAPLVLASDGFLYGTTPAPPFTSGTTSPYGTAFRLRPDGTDYAVVRSFGNGMPTDGRNPSSGLIEGGDGWMYGATQAGGTAGFGTLYRFSLDLSAHEILHSFTTNSDYGHTPLAGPAAASDGWLYGTTSAGGRQDSGVLFRIARNGSALEPLHALGADRTDGRIPAADLVQAGDGLIYGSTREGGVGNLGTLFRFGTSQAADLAVTLAAPSLLALGRDLTATASVSNAGPADAAGVVLIAPLPPNVLFVSAVSSQGSCQELDGNVVCALGMLPVGAAATVTLILTPTEAVSLICTASARSELVDGNGANDAAAAGTDVLAPPVIVQGPRAQTVVQGASVTLTVEATGNQLQYQWWLGTNEILHATNAILFLPAATRDAAGEYRVLITNAVGAAASAPALLRVLEPPTLALPPDPHTLEDTPVAVVAAVGDWETPASDLVVTTASSNPLLLPPDHVELSGTGSQRTLTLAPATNQSGTATITVTVRDADGLTAEGSFQLVVDPVPDPPVITAQPASVSVAEGTSATLSVTADGIGELTYQWQQGSTALTDQTNRTLVFTAVQLLDAGTYTVVVTGPEGAVTSDPAQVRVLVRPALRDVHVVAGEAGFSFFARKSCSYAVESAPSPGGAAWTAFPEIAGNGEWVRFTDTNAVPEMRYYRVRVW